jgi:5-hydroxyisourate hydrolase-like protein (transthyretin family)
MVHAIQRRGLAQLVGCSLVIWSSFAFAQGGAGGQRPARDAVARPDAPAGTATIGGRVIAADTGRPVKRARVMLQSSAVQAGGAQVSRSVVTDGEGRYEAAQLPAGKYTVTVTRTGFVTVSYGQRRPLQASTPLDVRDGEQLKNIDFRLPRGSVITGHVFDEDGEPIAQVGVRVMRWAFLQGERRLTPVGNDQTDDRGEYRVFGLPPGEYVVSAVARTMEFGPGLRQLIAGVAEAGGGRGAFAGGRGGLIAALGAPDADEDPVTFAATYYPGVTSIGEAATVKVPLAQEVSSIDFSLQLVRTARVSGTVVSSSGAAAAANVMMVPELAGANQAFNFTSRVQMDGRFELTNVPPGRYTIVARSMPALGGRGALPADAAPQQFAVQPIVVAGQDIDGVALVLGDGASLTGTVAFDNGQSTQSVNVTQIRITAPSVGGVQIPVRNGVARVEQDGTFALDGVPGGMHLIRASAPGGWWLKSVQVFGRDVTDTPIEIKNGQQVKGLSLVFSNLVTVIDGTVTDARNQPVSGVNVIAFPSDEARWQPQSRHIQTARPDQNGRFQLRGLPPGDYLIAAVDGAEQGEWFDPAFLAQIKLHSSRLTLSDGEMKTQDLKAFSVAQ